MDSGHLPRPCRLWWKTITTLADELGIHQAFSGKARNGFQKAAFVIVFALVESERLFIQIPEQMKRFNAHIRSFDTALEQRPEVFQPVSVNVAFRVALRVVNDLVDVFVIEFRVRAKSIRDYFRTLLHMFAHSGVKLRAAYVGHHLAADTRVRCSGELRSKQSHYSGLANATSS